MSSVEALWVALAADWSEGLMTIGALGIGAAAGVWGLTKGWGLLRRLIK